MLKSQKLRPTGDRLAARQICCLLSLPWRKKIDESSWSHLPFQRWACFDLFDLYWAQISCLKGPFSAIRARLEFRQFHPRDQKRGSRSPTFEAEQLPLKSDSVLHGDRASRCPRSHFLKPLIFLPVRVSWDFIFILWPAKMWKEQQPEIQNSVWSVANGFWSPVRKDLKRGRALIYFDSRTPKKWFMFHPSSVSVFGN